MNFPHFIYGCDYNPEQWPEELWPEDVRLMQEAGVNLVSLGIFSWARLEPEPGRYDFGWLDRILDLLQAGGISVNLATPTAAPPPWLVKLHPEILPVKADGTTLWHGSRRHYCPHSPAYHEYAERLVTRLADRYKDHPALRLWHVDNEYGCHVSECFCDTSAAAFRVWLRERYTTLEELNAAWGAAFWSQHYADWDEIQPPRQVPAQINPAQMLDWRRFSSQSWIDCFDRQKAILRGARVGVLSIHLAPAEEDGLADDQIFSIAVGSEGTLWVGTREGGVSRFDGETWTTFTVADGLPDSIISSLTVGPGETVWAGTYASVSRLDGERWTTFTAPDVEDDALQSSTVGPGGDL